MSFTASDVVFCCLTKDGKGAAAHIRGPARIMVAVGEKVGAADAPTLVE